MDKEALKLALEALEGFYEYGYDRRECFEHITAIKEALAQPKQEPVAYWDDEKTFVLPKQKEWDRRTGGISTFGCDTPLYTTPPQQELVCVCGAVWEGQELIYTPPQRTWVGLTPEEIVGCATGLIVGGMEFAEAIEAKLKEKNT